MAELFAAPLTNGIRYLLACLLVVSTSVTTEAAGKGTGVARFDPVVQRAVNFLKTKVKVESTGRSTLVAYACLKAGEPVDSKLIVAVLQIVLNKARSGVYKPLNSYEHIYEAGVDAMLLSDLDPVKYRSSIALIANYIQSQQRSDGSWSNGNNPGDISMSQYAVLGLWAAQRADVPIDPSVLDRTALWHMKSFKDGGFPYRPGTTEGPGKGAPTPNVTAGGLGSLAVIRHLFYPDVDKSEKKDTGLFDGVVENVKRKKKIRPSAFPDYSPSIGKATLDGGVRQSLSWTVTRFNPNMAQAHRIYYYYALERAFAMTDTKKVKGADWYLSCGDALARLQNEDGSWATHTGPDVGTSFAILFYMRSTSRILGKTYGSGLLQAARGLPDDLSRAFDPMNSEAEKKKKLDPLDDLLAALEKAEFGDTSDKDAEALAKKQQEIVEKIQNGDREELIGQVDRLKGLATHPHPDVRRTALWALGRSGDMMMAPILIKALKDVDVDVMVEARNALCCVSRRANGFGLSSSPLEELEDASPEKRTAAAITWSDKATENWQRWWFRVRPYDLRDDLEEAALLSAP
jgi:hypothetical protein